MLVNSAVIVLREVLEVALLLSVLLATLRTLELNFRWLPVPLFIGFLSAATYGYYLDRVSEMFAGFGQEIMGAVFQFGGFMALMAVVFLLGGRPQKSSKNATTLSALIGITIALAITGEGSDILVYVSGFWLSGDFISGVAIGSLIGAGIGFSVGVLFYYLLLVQPERRALPISVVLLILISGGMSTQAGRLLIQADWLTTAGALWDTSWFLPENSLTGQLLYALLGYEATPSGLEVFIHIAGIAAMTAAYFLGRNVQNGLQRDV